MTTTPIPFRDGATIALSELCTGDTIALVDENTLPELEYGDYRGWVHIDSETGEWLANLPEDAARMHVDWAEFPADYSRRGTIQ
jgi:hypothetical protein